MPVVCSPSQHKFRAALAAGYVVDVLIDDAPGTIQAIRILDWESQCHAKAIRPASRRDANRKIRIDTNTEKDGAQFLAILASLQADRWYRIKATMQTSGFDVEKGACLLVPASYLLIDPPDWVFPVSAPNITVPSMSQAHPEKKRLLFWRCPVRCGGAVAWDKAVEPPVAHCKCGLTSASAVPAEPTTEELLSSTSRSYPGFPRVQYVHFRTGSQEKSCGGAVSFPVRSR